MGYNECSRGQLGFPPECGLIYIPSQNETISSISAKMVNFAGLGSGTIYGTITRIDSMSGNTVLTYTHIATSTNSITFASDVPTWNGSGDGLSVAQTNVMNFSDVAVASGTKYLIGWNSPSTYLYFGSDTTACTTVTTGCKGSLDRTTFPSGYTVSAILSGSGAVTESGVQISTPSNQVYTGNPVPFTGTYDNLDAYNRIQFELIFNNNQNMVFNSITLPAVNGSGLTWGESRSLVYSGPYTLRARLLDTMTGSTTAWTATTSFALNSTSTNPLYVPDAPVSTEECTSGAIFCAMQQLFAWAFVPSPASVDQFKTLNTELAGRAPFAYVYAVPELFNELFDASPTASTTISVTIYDGQPNEHTFVFLSAALLESVPYSSTIRTVLGWILWLMLIQAFYYQVIRVHDVSSNTAKH